MKLRELKGLPMKRKDTAYAAVDIFRAPTIGYNQHIEEIENLEIGLNIEKTAEYLYIQSSPTKPETRNQFSYENLDEIFKEIWRSYARVLNANIINLIEIKKTP